VPRNIAKKLSTGFLGILSLLFLGSCVTFWQMTQIIQAQRLAECRSQETKASYEILSSVSQLNGALRGYIIARLNNDPDETTRMHQMIDQLWAGIDSAVGTLQGLDPKLRSAEARQRLPGLIADLNDTRRAQYQYLMLEESGDEGAHQASLTINLNSVLWAEKVRTGARSLVDVVGAATAREHRTGRIEAIAALVSAIMVTLLVGGIASAAATMVRRRLKTAVPALVANARQVSIGNLEVGELSDSSDDEIGELARSLGEIVRYLREMAAHSQAIAAGNLAIEIQPRSATDTLGNAFVQMRGGLQTLVVESRERAIEVASASREIASASDVLAKVGDQTDGRVTQVTSTMHEMSASLQSMVAGARLQAQRVSEASGSTHQMAASVELMAQSVSALTALCERSRGEVAAGLEGMERTEQGLHRIESVNRVAKENSQAMEVKTATIGRISSFIEEIAEQSHLLALNAAIEAARAGEHGAGFGVLAHELTKLADRSAESAHEIAGLVSSIQKEAAHADAGMVESTVAVEEGLQLARELRLSFTNIAKAVGDVSQHAQEIDLATRQQAAGSSRIADVSTHLEQLTQEMASAIEQQAVSTRQAVSAMDALLSGSREVSSSSSELAVSADQMSHMSQSLLQLMERFTLPDHHPAGHHRGALPTTGATLKAKATDGDSSSWRPRLIGHSRTSTGG